MGHRICTVAGKRSLLPLLVLVCLQCSSAGAQTKEQTSADQQGRLFDRPVVAEAAFGKDNKYLAMLFCCWDIEVYERQGNMQKMIWDWNTFDGAEGFKEDFVVRDVDADGSTEVAFRTSKTNFCRLESAAVLYSPEKKIVCLLQDDGETGLHLSPNLKDNQKAREWLVKYWQDWYKGDLNKITVTYDAKP